MARNKFNFSVAKEIDCNFECLGKCEKSGAQCIEEDDAICDIKCSKKFTCDFCGRVELEKAKHVNPRDQDRAICYYCLINKFPGHRGTGAHGGHKEG